MTRTSLPYDKPAPGAWSIDRVHQQAPAPPLLQPVLERHMTAGTREGFARMGALLECIEFRFVNGWLYTAPRPIGAPPESKGPPPRLLFKALLALHPTLRKRVRRAEEVLAERPWLSHADHYRAVLAPALRSRLDALRDVDVAGLEEAGLREHLGRAVALMGEAMEEHFVLSAHYTVAVGRLLAWAEGRPELRPAEAARVLAGSSPDTRRPAELLTAVADAIRAADCTALLDVPAADPGQAEATLAGLRAADPAVAEALDAWLGAYGWCTVGFDDINGVALLEQPALILATVRGAVERPPAPVPPEVGTAEADRLRARLPGAVQEAFDGLVREARHAMGPRELSCEVTFYAAGLLRRAALALGQRLVDLGQLDDAAEVLLCRPAELLAEDGVPDRAERERRRALLAAAGATPPPTVIGEVGEMPPAEWLPGAARELQEAVMAFVGQFDRPADRATPLTGLGVSPGVVEGRAFVLTGERDLDDVAAGDVLVAASTTASLNGVLARVGGLVTEYGGLICHAAIVSRELGFPGVVGCVDALAGIPHGAWIRIDGDTGRVEVLAGTSEGRVPATGAARRSVEPEVLPEVPATPGAWAALADAGDPARYGGKAAHLAAAVSAGLPVPAGVALDVDLVEGVAADDPAALARLEEALATLPEAPDGLAVRSSAPGEDGAGASFAGLHGTVLGVRGLPAVAAAVAEVWRSAHGPAARAYRSRLGIAGRPAMAVLLQPLLAADAAGVRFGRDPRTGADERVVEAAPGLGVAVVDGRVRPDRWTLAPDGAVRRAETGDKPVRVAPGEEGVVELPLAGAARRTACLSADQIAAVHALGEACDRLLGGPQDVEFALWAGRVHLLQSRPVTTGARP